MKLQENPLKCMLIKPDVYTFYICYNIQLANLRDVRRDFISSCIIFSKSLLVFKTESM